MGMLDVIALSFIDQTGLGWMISVRIWDELKGKWPKAYWDDWLREPKQTRL